MKETSTVSEAAALIARLDWARSPLGEANDWPQSLRTAVDIVVHSPMPMLLLWGSQLIQLYNDGFALLAGNKHPEAMGQPAHQTWPELESFTAPIYEAVLTGQVRTFSEQRFVLQRDHRDTEIWLDLTYSPVRDESGDVAGILVTAIETNERRSKTLELQQRSEDSLKAQHNTEQRLQLALAATDAVGTWDWDIGEDRFIADAHFAYLHGVHPSDAGLLPISDYLHGVHPEDRGTVARSIKHCITHGTEYAEEYRLLQADGQVRWVFARGRCYQDRHGRPARFLGAALDLTERKNTEQALRQSQTELQLIINAMPVLIGYVDHEQRFRLNNSAYLEWYGMTPQELYGKTIREVLGDEVYAGRADKIAAALKGKACSFLTVTPHRDGRPRHALMKYLPRFSNDGSVNGFYIFVIDETERKLTEEALRHLNENLEERVAQRTQALAEANQRLQNEMYERERAEDALRHAQKMEAVGQLTGGIAHDFNNMLTGILAAMDLMRMRIDEGRFDNLDRFMSVATTSAQRAAGLTQRLLAFSRRQSLDPRAVEVNAMVRSVEDLLTRTLGERVRLRTDLHEGLPSALVDTNQLESALLNLAINARDAMPDGGELCINTALAHLVGEPSGAAASSGPYVRLSVGDTGVGMDGDVLSRVFEPFYTTKPLGQGTGLGMSMIYGFIQQSEGHIRIDSTPGQGTTVELYLPLAAEGQGAPLAEADGVVVGGHGQRIVLVEDDAQVRVLTSELLTELGYHVDAAETADGALGILASLEPVDLLVTDVGLPGLNGRQLAEIVRQTRPALPILFMTGYAEGAAVRSEFLEAGMTMIAKPFNVDVFSQTVGRILAEGGNAPSDGLS